MTVTVEYAGKERIAFDDEHGIAKFIPVPEANPNQDAEVQFDLPEVEVEREPGEVESELWLSPLHERVDEQHSHGQNKVVEETSLSWIWQVARFTAKLQCSPSMCVSSHGSFGRSSRSLRK